MKRTFTREGRESLRAAAVLGLGLACGAAPSPIPAPLAAQTVAADPGPEDRGAGSPRPDGAAQAADPDGTASEAATGREYAASPDVRGATEPRLEYPFSFAVLGHIRGTADGRLNYLLDELISEVDSFAPDFVVLTGDLIWGEVQSEVTDPERIHAQWDDLDSALARLEVPVYRVPGNHDISDVATRRIYEERYGAVPRTVDLGPTRLVLYGSGFLPEPGDERKNVFIRGVQPDSALVAWLRKSVPGPEDESPPDHVFLFMHHLLWWAEQDSSWWRQAHPILADGDVRAAFSGDYGPMKFSHLERDGVEYYQSGIAPEPAVLGHLRAHEWNRLLAGQFDNYLVVRVPDEETVEVDVRTLGETESGDFTPVRWREVHGGIRRPGPPGGRERLALLWEYPRGKLFLLGLPILGLLGGLGAGLWLRRRRGA